MLSRIIIRRSIVVNKNYYHSGRKVNKANDSAGGGSLLDGIWLIYYDYDY